MAAGPQERCEPFALVVGASGGLAATLSYLFQVVADRSTRFCVAARAQPALAAGRVRPEVVVVNLTREPDSGRDVVRAANGAGHRPVVVAVVSEGDDCAAVEAFLAGADDVVREPLQLRELALRLEVRLADRGIHDFKFGRDGRIDWDAETEMARRAALTATEARIVHLLMQRDGAVVTRDELSWIVDGRPWEYGDRKFDVHVASIRRKLQAAFGSGITLETVRAEGYRLDVSGLDWPNAHSS